MSTPLPLLGREQAAGYLAGIIDGEGCMKWVGNKKYGKTLVLTITNTDWDILDATMDCCDVLDLKYRIEEVAKCNHELRDWNRAWCISITGRASLQTISDEVPFRSKKKRERLNQRLSSYVRFRTIRDQRGEARQYAARARAESV